LKILILTTEDLSLNLRRGATMNTPKLTFKQPLKLGLVLSSLVLSTAQAQPATATTPPAAKSPAATATPVVTAPTATPPAATPPTAPKPAETKKAEPEKAPAVTAPVANNAVLSVAAGNWNSDRRPDAALLIKADDQADLYLYFNDGKGGMELKQVKKSLVWAGNLAGTLPKLTSGKRGVFYVDSQNEAVGRNRWSQRLTVQYRGNEFLVIGYTYTARDTLDLKYSLSCDFDLLTGKGVKNKQSGTVPKQTVKLSDWQDDNAITKQCRN
jgi:hypothetical protein